jgi:hypothetical protein
MYNWWYMGRFSMCNFFMEAIYLILSGLEIKKHIGKEIIIEPYNEKCVRKQWH